MRVKTVEYVEGGHPVDVYDIGVENNHSFCVRPQGSIHSLVVHNCHGGAATEYARVLDYFSARIMLGLTATPDRKDGKYFIVENLMGPILIDTKVENLTPNLMLVDTGITVKGTFRSASGFTRYLRALEKHNARTQLILKYVKKALSKGHSVLVPTAFRSQSADLVKLTNQMMGKRVAEELVGGGKRTEILTRARSGKTKVIFGSKKLLTGVDVPPWSCIIEITPTSNPPKDEQELSRVLTPMEGKNTPLIIIFVDDHGISKGCFRSLFRTATSDAVGAKLLKSSRKLVGSLLPSAKSDEPVSVKYDDDEFKPVRTLTSNSFKNALGVKRKKK